MKDFLKKTWQFLWHEDSWYAWIAQVIVAFILIKYILYPLIGLVFGTSLPIVAVVSSSMDHQGDFLCADTQAQDWWEACGEWYEENNISQEQFSEFPLRNGFRKGDVIALRGIQPDKLETGDVIVFAANKQYPIIHRIVDRTSQGFVTKGDNNPFPIQQYAVGTGSMRSECYQVVGQTIIVAPCGGANTQIVNSQTPGAYAVLDETRVQEQQIIGKAYARIPYVGYVKILFVDFLAFIGLNQLANAL